MSGPIKLERRDAVVELVIDQPPVNALGADDWRALDDGVREIDDDPSVRAIVLTGHGGAFCAGADIHALIDRDADDHPATMLDVVGQVARSIRDARAPVIAAIDGPAHGGGLELALACDLRVSGSSATFAASGVTMGLLASVSSLVDAVGEARARRMLLTGQPIDAERALRWGLVTDLADPAVDTAHAIAGTIAAKAPLAVEATKRAIRARPSMDSGAHAALVRESFIELTSTVDHDEAIAAFLEKRPPNFGRH